MEQVFRLKNKSCAICGTTKGKKLGTRSSEPNVSRSRGSLEVDILKCSGCGLIYPEPFPMVDPKELASLYSTSYFQEDPFGSYRSQWARSQLWGIEKRLGRKGKILDVGCGEGAFIAVADEAGWDVHGVDVSPAAGQKLPDKLRDRIYIGTLEDLKLPEGSFDAVNMQEVLEHVYEPKVLMQAIARILKVGGIVGISVPNAEALVYWATNVYFRAMGRSWASNSLSPFQPPYHVLGFSKRSLRVLLEASGFHMHSLQTMPGSARLAGLLGILRGLVVMMGGSFDMGEEILAFAEKHGAA